MATLFLGVGTQKAGTTWLYYYFCEHPQVAVPADKEIHYLDAKYGPPEVGAMLRHRKAKIEGTNSNGEPLPPERKAALTEIVGICERQDDSDYVSYLEQHCNHSTKAFGEITPSYCVLREQDWEQFAKTAPNTKFIFLMRDPLSRLISAAKMMRRDNGTESLAETFEAIMNNPGHLMRTEYHKTLGAIEAVFGADNLFVGFYEALFTDAEMYRLTKFLGIDFIKPNYKRRENSSEGSIQEIPFAYLKLARARLEPVYQEIKQRYPIEVKTYWPHEKLDFG